MACRVCEHVWRKRKREDIIMSPQEILPPRTSIFPCRRRRRRCRCRRCRRRRCGHHRRRGVVLILVRRRRLGPLLLLLLLQGHHDGPMGLRGHGLRDAQLCGPASGRATCKDVRGQEAVVVVVAVVVRPWPGRRRGRGLGLGLGLGRGRRARGWSSGWDRDQQWSGRRDWVQKGVGAAWWRSLSLVVVVLTMFAWVDLSRSSFQQSVGGVGFRGSGVLSGVGSRRVPAQCDGDVVSIRWMLGPLLFGRGRRPFAVTLAVGTYLGR
jgi:hypothetical protein